MKKKEPLVIRFRSHIPPAYMAQFPPGRRYLAASPSEALTIIAGQPDDYGICLANPPEFVLNQLKDRAKKTENIILFYDLLPKPEECSTLSSFHVMVPSLCFYYFFRQHGVNAKLVNLLSLLKIDRIERTKQTEENLPSRKKICLWIDERLIAPCYQTEIARVISALLKKYHSGLNVIWVSEKKRHFSSAGVHLLRADNVGRIKEWQKANIILTLGSSFQSLVSLHLQFLSRGIAVITDDRGDHCEWVNHLFTGFVLGRKGTCKELGRYLLRMLKDPGLLQRFHENGPLLLERVIQTGNETSTGQFGHSS